MEVGTMNDGSGRLSQLCRAVLRSLFVLVNNLYCIPTYVVWCFVLHPVYLLFPDLYWQLEGVFFQWLLTMVAYWSYSAGYYIVESGDSIENLAEEETLVLVNHQSTSDVPLLMYAFCSRTSLLEKLNWIMDAVFKYTNFGIVSSLHGDFFINAGRNRRDASLKDLENFLHSRFLPRKRKWLVLFPEGGFLRKRKETSKRYAEKLNLPNLEYVTLPRMGALQTIINTLAPFTVKKASTESTKGSVGEVETTGKLKHIIDMTIAYPKGVPLGLDDVITGNVPPCNIRMHYKVYPIDQVPHTNPDEMQKWLYNIYIEKNNMLGHYYKTGVWNPAKFAKKDINCKSKTGQDPIFKKVLQSSVTGLDVVDRVSVSNQHSRVIGDGTQPFEFWLDDRKSEAHCQFEKGDAWIASGASIVDDECIYEPLSQEEWETLESNEKTLHLDLLRVFLIHLMFISSTLAHIYAFRYLLQWWFV